MVKLGHMPIRDDLLRRWRALDAGWRWALTAFLLIRLFYGLWSLAILKLSPLVVQNLELFGEPLVSAFSLRTSRAFLFQRVVDGNLLTFRPAGASALVDAQTGSLWDLADGRAVQGPLKDEVLPASPIAVEQVFPYHGVAPYPAPWLALWQRFDANWYLSLAERGYGAIPGDLHFPPLYPVIIRAFTPLVGSSFLAGLLISHLAALFLLKLLYDLFHEWGPAPGATRAVAYLLVFPTSFFFFSVYTEPLFIVMAVLALRSMKRESWPWAGFWTFCAILTRLQGAALAASLVYLMWKDRPFLRKPAHWFGLALPALAASMYLLLRAQSGTESVLPVVEPDWYAHLVPPWETYLYAIQTLFSGHFQFVDLLNWLAATLFILILAFAWRKLPAEYNIYLAVSLLIILSRKVETQPLISMTRYSLMLFPAFFPLGGWAENPWVQRLIAYSFFILNLFLSAQFWMWGWVA